MTARLVVEFDSNVEGDVDAQVDAAIRAFEMSSFDRISRRLTELAAAILEAAELPSDSALMYVLREADNAQYIEPATPKDVEGQTMLLALDQAVLLAGFERDSAEGYAGRILTKLRYSGQLLADGDTQTAMALAFEIGGLVTEASMKAVFERDFLVGEKVIAGGSKGHFQTHGTSEEKEAKRSAYVAAFEAALAKGLRKMAACELAAEQCGVSVATIRRALEKQTS